MRIGLIAGSGQFPLIFTRAAKKKGYSIYAAAYINEADPILGEHVDDLKWLHLGQINRLIKFFKKNGIQQAVMIGGVRKTGIFSDIKPDIKAISLITRLQTSHDDGILRAFSNLLEKQGIKILSSTFLLPELVARAGCWTKRKPSALEKQDIQIGWRMAKAIGRMDIGQCVVVGNGTVLAVEAIEGTDAAIKRGGSFGRGCAVAVKVCKPNQDRRFDMPAVGTQTIQTMCEAGVSALAIEAGKAIVFDREEMVALADKHGIAVVAIEQEEQEQWNIL
ncbi:MAG: UDP-2,3-diacylglucosamine diphosphatase LpxI [Deltaproteobacteria bacterium]|nr:UDP-2,3-diacylglucosamine diphosphatase LpxI [Deltaproteobacteria bacterium]MBW1962737.1 UDP-2,3-diacylglucosamine diphosphatase LpxI [Deltaproteobacteria bacterium]MBW2150843.1 UDP-2,3-diacylglucosamine diphosphatase LpxI [Deltaproteobacteria bacterium]